MMEKQKHNSAVLQPAEHQGYEAMHFATADMLNCKLRLRFEKTGRAIYISHLDLMTTMQRAFARADVMLKYSEGFNPHPLISILLPLSVGTGSMCELMDFRLREESFLAADSAEDGMAAERSRDRLAVFLKKLPERLNDVLPEGIRVQDAYPAERKGAGLKWLEVEGTMEYDRCCPPPEALAEFFSRESIPVEKKTKRGMGTIDLRPAIQWIRFEEAMPKPDSGNSEELTEGTIQLHAMISAQEPTLNPELLVHALRQQEPTLCPDFARFLRIETYDAEGKIFR